MKKIIFGLVIAAFLVACQACYPDPKIDCWYVSSVTQAIGEPWFILYGRHVSRYGSDIRGPLFQKEEQAHAYVVNNNLKLCGTK